MLQAINMTHEAQRLAASFGEVLRGDTTSRVSMYYARLDSLAGLDAQRRQNRGPGPTPPPTFRALNGSFVNMLNAQENGDMAPSPALLSTFTRRCKELQGITGRWEKLLGADLAEINGILKTRGKAALGVPSSTLKPPSC
jgi:hypothetical protein